MLIFYAIIVVFSSILVMPAFADPYIGLEYGMTVTSHDVDIAVEGKQLNPSHDGGIVGFYTGYKFNENLAVAIGYRDYSTSERYNEKSIKGLVITDKFWDADVNIKQLTLMPMYFVELNDEWTVKTGIGVTYTEYDFNSSYKEIEKHYLIENQEKLIKEVAGESGSLNRFGGIATIGFEYVILPRLPKIVGWTIGANMTYQLDSYMNTVSFSLETNFYF